MLDRHLEGKIKKAAAEYPVVTLTGPRQSGKTTLVRAAFHDYAYVSLEDPEARSFALEDPRGFLRQWRDEVILDEVQRCPELFSYIQTIVDEEDRPGQFILTGSQNFLLLKSISQSLAGRCAIFHLLPLSYDELAGRPSLPVDQLGSVFPADRPIPDRDLNDCLHRGFYPRIHDKGLEAQDWLRNYYQTYLERDVREIINVGDLEAFRRFTALCAGRTGQLLNFTNLASDCGITHTTARRWLSVLEASFIVVLLRPHHQNFCKRLVKTPKLYFVDTGLLCYLLRIRKPEELTFHAARGAIFESFVVAELYKRAFNAGVEPDYFFWRDSAGHEVDIIIDLGDEVIPLEIKSGSTLNKDFFKGLEYWQHIAGEKAKPRAALIYGGNSSVVRNAIHVYAWWNF
ncbi:MAG: ATP-binding protein [Deltaproteobacteria bacterium]|nr:ATP-binding protein [Candidatus Anaeroferrophillus wilburensis]MBN2889277.1 ATP-binding protein [Deltaproteobacteria bacterium]